MMIPTRIVEASTEYTYRYDEESDVLYIDNINQSEYSYEQNTDGVYIKMEDDTYRVLGAMIFDVHFDKREEEIEHIAFPSLRNAAKQFIEQIKEQEA